MLVNEILFEDDQTDIDKILMVVGLKYGINFDDYQRGSDQLVEELKTGTGIYSREEVETILGDRLNRFEAIYKDTDFWHSVAEEAQTLDDVADIVKKCWNKLFEIESHIEKLYNSI